MKKNKLSIFMFICALISILSFLFFSFEIKKQMININCLIQPTVNKSLLINMKDNLYSPSLLINKNVASFGKNYENYLYKNSDQISIAGKLIPIKESVVIISDNQVVPKLECKNLESSVVIFLDKKSNHLLDFINKEEFYYDKD